MSTAANWDGVFKKRYGKFVNPAPSDNTIAEWMTFVPRDMQGGDSYNFPVKLTHEHGFTPNVDNSAFALNSAVDSTTKNATLSGASIVLRGTVPYDVVSKLMHGAQNGGAGGSGYFDAVDLKVMGLMESGELYREMLLMYGAGTGAAAAANIGVVSASISGANVGATQVVSITKASWAPGLWNNLHNAVVDIYEADATTVRVATVTVSAVSKSNNRVSLYKSGSAVTVAAGDVILLRDTLTKSCYGIQAILQNSGTLFGISAATYAQWQCEQISAASGTLDRAKILEMAAKLYANGLRDGGKLFVSGTAFADLAEEADELQRFQGDTAVKRQGSENLEYRSPAGVIQVAVHTYMKQGLAMFIARDCGKRVGNTDLTFSLPGSNKWFFSELPDNAGSQLRLYSNQAPVLEKPYHCALISNIVSTGDTAP